jgi:hypothetical protein
MRKVFGIVAALLIVVLVTGMVWPTLDKKTRMYITLAAVAGPTLMMMSRSVGIHIEHVAIEPLEPGEPIILTVRDGQIKTTIQTIDGEEYLVSGKIKLARIKRPFVARSKGSPPPTAPPH